MNTENATGCNHGPGCTLPYCEICDRHVDALSDDAASAGHSDVCPDCWRDRPEDIAPEVA